MKSTNDYILMGMKEHKKQAESNLMHIVHKYRNEEINFGELVKGLDDATKLISDLVRNIARLEPQNDEIPF